MKKRRITTERVFLTYNIVFRVIHVDGVRNKISIKCSSHGRSQFSFVLFLKTVIMRSSDQCKIFLYMNLISQILLDAI